MCLLVALAPTTLLHARAPPPVTVTWKENAKHSVHECQLSFFERKGRWSPRTRDGTEPNWQEKNSMRSQRREHNSVSATPELTSLFQTGGKGMFSSVCRVIAWRGSPNREEKENVRLRSTRQRTTEGRETARQHPVIGPGIPGGNGRSDLLYGLRPPVGITLAFTMVFVFLTVIKCFARLMSDKSDIPGNTRMPGHEAGYAQLFPSAQLSPSNHPPSSYGSTNELFSSAHMSHSHLTSASSLNFQLIINNALEAYKKRTKNDLLAHPLAPQLQACDSPGAILAVLQQQVQGLDQSRNDDRWTKWLDPTINVLFSFSATLGTGVGLVCSRTCAYLRSAHLYLFGRYFHPRA
jgi:hypothetical protein